MSPSASSASDARFERKLSVTAPVTLEIGIRSGGVRVLRGEDGSVTIRGLVRARSSLFNWSDPEQTALDLAQNPPVIQDGNHIQVGDVADRFLLRRIDLMLDILTPAATRLRAFSDSADLRVEGIDGPVNCEADSGEIEINGIQSEVRAHGDSGGVSISSVAGPVDAHTDSGEILLRDIGGSVDARSDSGAIQIAAVGSYVNASCDSGAIHISRVTGRVEAETDSGALTAFEIGGAIDVHSDSGAIELSQSVIAPVRARADSGRITVKLAPGGYNLRLRTDHGSLEVPPIAQASSSRHQIEGSLGGGGPMVDLKTDSGTIQVL